MAPSLDRLYGAMVRTDPPWSPSPAHVLRRHALLRTMRPFPPGRLLDIGCGAGRLIVDFARLGHWGTAVELDPEAQRMAKECVAAFNLDFDVMIGSPREVRGTFDYVTAIEVLEHLDDPVEAVGGWSELLAPKGLMIVSVPSFQRQWGASDEWAGHLRRFEPEELRDVFVRNGFVVLQQSFYGFPVGNAIRAIGNVVAARRIRQRSHALTPWQATLASGRDRSAEIRWSKVSASWYGRRILELGVVLQIAFSRPPVGVGMILVAQRTGQADADS